MIKFVNISALKNGKNKYSFSQLEICKILKNELGFRFKKVGTKGLYLSKNESNGYDIIDFPKITEAFLTYVEKTFKNIENLEGTTYADFLNAFHSKSPLKNTLYCSNFLGEDFDLDEESLHRISMLVDKAYKYKNDVKKMFSFLKNEGFKIENEANKKYRYDELFCYKRASDEQFIIFHREFTNRDKNEPIFSCWLFNTDSEEAFSRSKMDFYKKEELTAHFNLDTDMDIYNNPSVE